MLREVILLVLMTTVQNAFKMGESTKESDVKPHQMLQNTCLKGFSMTLESYKDALTTTKAYDLETNTTDEEPNEFRRKDAISKNHLDKADDRSSDENVEVKSDFELFSPFDLMMAQYKFKHDSESDNETNPESLLRGQEMLLTIGIHCNSKFKYGISQSIVLSLDKLVTINAFVNVTTNTSDYLIDAFMWTQTNNETVSRKSKWRHTQFLGKELLLNDIREHTLLPFQSGYYRVIKATFWEVGELQIQLYMSNVYDTRELYGSDVRNISVVSKDQITCYPKLTIPQCSDPEYPVTVDVSQTSTFDVIFEETCGMGSMQTLNWNLFGVPEKEIIKHIGKSKSHSFRVAKYTFMQITKHAHLVIRADTIMNDIMVVARCYIFVPPPPVWAKIVGGSKRMINNDKINILEGSESVDEANPNKLASHLRMHWHCTSIDDSDNDFCSRLNITGKSVAIPEGALNESRTYQFFLRVYSSLYHVLYKETSQKVTVTPEATLTPHIVCVNNCDWNQFDPTEHVNLEARCVDCSKNDTPVFEWYYDNKLYDYANHSGSPHLFSRNLDKDSQIKLRMRVARKLERGAQTHYTEPVETSYYLRTTGGPVIGNCSVSPDKGTEALTYFTIICDGLEGGAEPVFMRIESTHDVRVPIAYFRRTKRVLLYLPETADIVITCCDRKDRCDELEVIVDVDPAEVTSTLKSFKRFLEDNSLKTNLEHVLRRGLWQRGFIIAHAVAKIAIEHELLECLHGHMYFYQTRSPFQLEQYMFLTVTLVSRIRPLYDDSAVLFADYLDVTANNMELILEDNESITKDQFASLTRGLLYILLTFSSERDELTIAMCKSQDIMCIVGERLSQNFLILDPFDPNVATKINNWLKAATKLNRNFYMLTAFASFSLHTEDNPIQQQEENAFLKLQTVSTSTDSEEILSQDGDIKVIISKQLKKEIERTLKREDMVLLILTQPDDDGLYWWYPEPVPIISTIITIYAANLNSRWPTNLPHIENPIKFDVHATVSHNQTEDWFINGTLTTQYHMQIFTTILVPKAVLVLSMIKNTDEVRIWTSLGKALTGRELHEKGCVVTKNDTGFRLRLTSFCKETQTVYIALSPNILIQPQRSYVQRYIRVEEPLSNPIQYSFMLEVYQCTDWVDSGRNPGWQPNICQTDVDLNKDLVSCTCHGLGPFSPRIYRAFARPFSDSSLMPAIMINWILVLVFLLLLLLLLGVIITYVGATNASIRGSTVTCVHKTDDPNPQSIIIVIRTGGQANAGTSANVIFFFRSADAKAQETAFVINQDPEHPKLSKNWEITLRITTDSFTMPVSLRMEIDKQGRYPSWYCRRVIIYNLTDYTYQIFLVRSWVHDRTPWIESPHYGSIYNPKSPYTCRRRFKNRIEENFNNWFFLQPMTGPWRNSDFTNSMNRLERSCLWICKASISICIVVCYFGSANDAYDKQEEVGSENEIDIVLVIRLSFICFLVCIFFEFLFRVIIMRWILKRY